MTFSLKKKKKWRLTPARTQLNVHREHRFDIRCRHHSELLAWGLSVYKLWKGEMYCFAGLLLVALLGSIILSRARAHFGVDRMLRFLLDGTATPRI